MDLRLGLVVACALCAAGCSGDADCDRSGRCGAPLRSGGDASVSDSGTGPRDGGPAGADGGQAGADGGTAGTDRCSNGQAEGEGICELGGDTLVACRRGPAGVLISLRMVCGGATPSCAAAIVAGKPVAACCPTGNVNDPADTSCTER